MEGKNRTEDNISINQKGYVKQALYSLGLGDCKPVSTPMEPEKHLTLGKKNDPRCDREVYQRAAGKLMWAMLVTRLDISYPVNVLSQFTIDPTEDHLVASQKS